MLSGFVVGSRRGLADGVVRVDPDRLDYLISLSPGGSVAVTVEGSGQGPAGLRVGWRLTGGHGHWKRPGRGGMVHGTRIVASTVCPRARRTFVLQVGSEETERLVEVVAGETARVRRPASGSTSGDDNVAR